VAAYRARVQHSLTALPPVLNKMLGLPSGVA